MTFFLNPLHCMVILLQDALCVCVPKHIDRVSVCGNTVIVFLWDLIVFWTIFSTKTNLS